MDRARTRRATRERETRPPESTDERRQRLRHDHTPPGASWRSRALPSRSRGATLCGAPERATMDCAKTRRIGSAGVRDRVRTRLTSAALRSRERKLWAPTVTSTDDGSASTDQLLVDDTPVVRTRRATRPGRHSGRAAVRVSGNRTARFPPPTITAQPRAVGRSIVAWTDEPVAVAHTPVAALAASGTPARSTVTHPVSPPPWKPRTAPRGAPPKAGGARPNRPGVGVSASAAGSRTPGAARRTGSAPA